MKMNLVMAETKLNAAQKELAAAEKKLKRKEKSLNQCKEIQCGAVAESKYLIIRQMHAEEKQHQLAHLSMD